MKYQINLLQAELLPKSPPLTLQRVLLAWGLVLIVMLGIVFYVHAQLQQVTTQNQQLTALTNQQASLMSELEQQVKQHRADPALAEQLVKLKTVLKYKQALQHQLTNGETAYVAGFSGAMTELAQYHQADVSLQQVKINTHHMLYTGIAKTPDAVPLWLAGFNQSKLLSGMMFSHFKLTENEQKVTEFVVSSKVGEQ
jgi:Tfp pilus assembly protein PilN